MFASKETSLSDLSDEGLESEDNLEGTGLLGSEKNDEQDSGIEDEQEHQEDQQDVKPLILAPINFDSSVPIMIDADSDVEQSEVTNRQDKDNVDSDCYIVNFQPGTAPQKNVDRVVRECKYTCYLCQETFTMQK